MYEAPDRYKRLVSARLPGGESAGLAANEAGSETSPLRDVQLMSRAHLAPFFAAANIVAALMMAANLWSSISATWLLPWVMAVGAVISAPCRWRESSPLPASAGPDGRSRCG